MSLAVRFYVGLHMPNHASRFERCMVSVNRLRGRKSDFPVREWMMDSGAFTAVTQHGGFRYPVEEYAEQIHRWRRCGNLVAAVAQDFMCEPVALAATGGTVAEHQWLTVERYEALRRHVASTWVMPVLQGWEPADYARHVRMYGRLLRPTAWVGVGSVCKRNSDTAAIEDVLRAVHRERPDLRLHGFGLKATALHSEIVRRLLYSSDSMAWSWAARKQGRNANDPREAERFVRHIRRLPVQGNLWGAVA